MRGNGHAGLPGSQPMCKAVHITWHGAQNNYLCTYDFYSPVHNVLDACISITRASGRGWALEFERFLGPVKWHRADRRVPFGAQKTHKKLWRSNSIFNLCSGGDPGGVHAREGEGGDGVPRSHPHTRHSRQGFNILTWYCRLMAQVAPLREFPSMVVVSTAIWSRSMHLGASSVADPGCLSRIPVPDFYPSRIPDPGSRIPYPGSRIPDPKTAIKERGKKKFDVIPFM